MSAYPPSKPIHNHNQNNFFTNKLILLIAIRQKEIRPRRGKYGKKVGGIKDEGEGVGEEGKGIRERTDSARVHFSSQKQLRGPEETRADVRHIRISRHELFHAPYKRKNSYFKLLERKRWWQRNF